MQKMHPSVDPSAPIARQIDAQIKSLGGWRAETLARVRQIILGAGPPIVEALKWGATPVWSHEGIICTGEAYKAAVKLTFAKGASLPDPTGLFNSSLEGATRRAIDIREGETIDEPSLKALIQAAAGLNAQKPAGARQPSKGA
jgi:hypothetical protein